MERQILSQLKPGQFFKYKGELYINDTDLDSAVHLESGTIEYFLDGEKVIPVDVKLKVKEEKKRKRFDSLVYGGKFKYYRNIFIKDDNGRTAVKIKTGGVHTFNGNEKVIPLKVSFKIRSE